MFKMAEMRMNVTFHESRLEFTHIRPSNSYEQKSHFYSILLTKKARLMRFCYVPLMFVMMHLKRFENAVRLSFLGEISKKSARYAMPKGKTKRTRRNKGKEGNCKAKPPRKKKKSPPQPVSLRRQAAVRGRKRRECTPK